MAAFVLVENRVEAPIIHIRFPMDRTVLCALLANWLTTLSRFGVVFYAPVFFLVQGYSATQAGLAFVPSSLAVSVTSIGTGLVVQYTGSYYTVNASLDIIFVASSLTISAISQNTPLWVLYVCLFFLGGSCTGLLSTTLLAFTATVDRKYEVRCKLLNI